MLGFYFDLIDDEDNPLCGMMGPYSTTEEVEKAAHRAWRTKDY